MAGWKTWQALEEVTATDFQNYIQDQVVQVYTNSSARSSALGTSVTAGMVSYLTSSSAVEYYNGSAWTVIDAGDITQVTAGTGLTGGGSSGAVTLDVNYDAVGSALLASPTITGTATIANGTVTGILGVGGTVTLPTTTSIGSVSSTELSYLDGVTSGIQAQLDVKAASTATITINGSATTIGGTASVAGFLNVGMISGHFYSGSFGRSNDQTGVAGIVNRVYYSPLIVTETTTFDRIDFRTGSSGYTANTATFRLGIYASSAGAPGTLILDAGTTLASAVNTAYPITINQSLNAGVYWLAIVREISTGTMLGNQGSQFQMSGGSVSTSAGFQINSSLLSSATVAAGSLPSSAGAVAPVEIGPTIRVRKA